MKEKEEEEREKAVDLEGVGGRRKVRHAEDCEGSQEPKGKKINEIEKKA